MRNHAEIDSEFKDIRMSSVKWKYGEKRVLMDIEQYINSTYTQHYTNDANNIQALDVYKARGTLTDTCIDNCIKYLMRYGKKDGYNTKDLMKAIHYLILAAGNSNVGTNKK